ncbi:triosephosphate isomerase [Sanghuangporus baumii]|uniref:Triosephosphate isomerase n=1 Tax=Sanghuangporus baumii TaxID=108892 RepID=A0A9Q5HVW9_SANBA|nr:triosephosphate isomerase [Sanghuangporus baumii]
MARKFFVGGNFKMNPATRAEKVKLVETLAAADLDPNVDVVIAPPALYVIPTAELLKAKGNSFVKVAAQNCYIKSSGAFTGETSPAQLADAEIPYVILGHSERRTLFHETSAFVAQKTKAAIDTGLSVILCIGETLAEREAGTTLAVVEEQLNAVVPLLSAEEWSKIVIAYEPVWAIGTGKVATAAQAQEVHAAIRNFLSKAVSPSVAENTRIIYGGSVSEKAAPELASQPDIDGFLVGGASLKPEFIAIVNVLRKS